MSSMLPLILACLLGMSGAESGLRSETASTASCTDVRFTCTMNVASGTLLSQLGCNEAECTKGGNTNTNLSHAILEFFEVSEGSHEQRRKRITRGRRQHSHGSSGDTSGCLMCPEPTLESIQWQAAGTGSTTVIEASINMPPEDAPRFSDFLDANVASLNSIFGEHGIPVCSKVDVSCCKHEDTMDLRIVHIFVVLACSGTGSVIPFTPLSKMRDLMFVFRALSAGVILGLAFAHIIPESFELNDKTTYGSLNGIFFMIGIFLTFAGERLGIELQSFSSSKAPSAHQQEMSTRPTSGNDVESQNSIAKEPGADDLGAVEVSVDQDRAIPGDYPTTNAALRRVVAAHSIELGFIVHTVLLGIDVGMWEEGRATLKAFTVAMGFHQFFEGVGLGVHIQGVGDAISKGGRALMLAAFTLSFPMSICIGIGLSHSVVDEGLKGWITGALNATAGGILIYMGLVSFLAEDFLQSDYVTRPDKWLLRLQMTAALAVGMLSMSVIAMWG